MVKNRESSLLKPNLCVKDRCGSHRRRLPIASQAGALELANYSAGVILDGGASGAVDPGPIERHGPGAGRPRSMLGGVGISRQPQGLLAPAASPSVMPGMLHRFRDDFSGLARKATVVDRGDAGAAALLTLPGQRAGSWSLLTHGQSFHSPVLLPINVKLRDLVPPQHCVSGLDVVMPPPPRVRMDLRIDITEL
jgi:hypothetical protein